MDPKCHRPWNAVKARAARPARTFAESWGPGLLAVVIAMVLLPVFSQLGVTTVSRLDVGLYRYYGETIVAGAVPFRDVGVEYPPAAVAIFVLPALVTVSRFGYGIVFGAMVGTIGVVGLVLAARIGTMLAPPSRGWLIRTLATAFMIGLLGAVALTRFDFVPAALTVAALYALITNRFGWAGVLLGAAVAVKLYPAVLVPVAAVYVLRRSGAWQAAAFIGLAIVVVLASYVPFLLVAPEGVVASLRVQVDRGLQIESSGASLLWLARGAGLMHWPEQDVYYELTFREADIVAVASAVAGFGVVAWLCWQLARGPADGARLVRYAFASVAAFVVFAKVLSPQYLLWLVLLVPALRGTGTNAVAGLLAAAVVITASYFPESYRAVALDLAPLWLGLIALRNFLLAALVAVLVFGMARPATPRALGR
jgi:uncharacterized membrane protein